MPTYLHLSSVSHRSLTWYCVAAKSLISLVVLEISVVATNQSAFNKDGTDFRSNKYMTKSKLQLYSTKYEPTLRWLAIDIAIRLSGR